MENNDHDLLIRVDTKLGTLITEFQLLRDNTNQRLTKVEQDKVNHSDFNEFKINNKNRSKERRNKYST